MLKTIFRVGALAFFVCAITATLHAHGVAKFENGRWFDGSSFQPKVMYSVEGVLRETWTGEVDRVVDLEDRFVVSPLADAHTHAFADGTDAAAQVASFLGQGIFYAKNPNNLPELRDKASSQVNQRGAVEVIYSNGGLTSSGGHPVQIYDRLASQNPDLEPADLKGRAYFEIDNREDLDRAWPAILAKAPDFIKVMLEYSEEHESRKGEEFYGRRGLDPELLPVVVERAHADGLTVSAHVASAADFRTAVEAGVDEINHLPIEKISSDDARAAADRGVVVVTTTISHRPTGHVEDLQEVLAHNLRQLRDGGVRLVLGTDSGRTVVSEIENIERLGVFSDLEILQLATVNTAPQIFPERKLGQLSDGFEASFLGLRENPILDVSALTSIDFRVMKGDAFEVTVPEVVPGIGDQLGHEVMTSGVEAAIATYHRLRQEAADEYDFAEPQLNALGYALLQHGRTEDAVKIFELNAEMFPEGANTYDSLAESYMLAGQKELAVENYRKSLELNPHNDNAREKLRELDDETTDPH